MKKEKENRKSHSWHCSGRPLLIQAFEGINLLWELMKGNNAEERVREQQAHEAAPCHLRRDKYSSSRLHSPTSTIDEAAGKSLLTVRFMKVTAIASSFKQLPKSLPKPGTPAISRGCPNY